MRRHYITFLCLVFLAARPPLGCTTDAKDEVRTVKGIKFKIPEDWPIEEHGGALGPVPIEQYITLKFRKMEERFNDMETKLGADEKRVSDLNAKVVMLGQSLKKIEDRIQRASEALHA